MAARGGTRRCNCPMARHQQRPESSRPLINKPPPTRFLFDKHRSLTETLPGQTLNVTLRGSCAAAANLENARINVHSKEIKSRAVTEPPQVDSAEQAVAGLQTKRFSLSSPKEVWSENKKQSYQSHRVVGAAQIRPDLQITRPTQRHSPIFTRQNDRPGLKSKNFNSFPSECHVFIKSQNTGIKGLLSIGAGQLLLLVAVPQRIKRTTVKNNKRAVFHHIFLRLPMIFWPFFHPKPKLMDV